MKILESSPGTVVADQKQSAYDLFFSEALFPAWVADKALNWLEQAPYWGPSIQSFYEISEIWIKKSLFERELRSCFTNEIMKATQTQLELFFDTPFAPFMKLTAHKMETGQWIGLH